MNSIDREVKDLIDRHLKWPSDLAYLAARDRVREALLSTPAHLQTPRVADALPVIPVWRLAAAAAAVVAMAIGTAIVWPRAPELYTAGTAGTQVTLVDGSQVEMRAHAELTVEREDDGLGIYLRRGDIIVRAAKQRGGHLYVHTKDMTIAVVGTVFLVNTGSDGSCVAVIEGEVRVREKNIDTRLRPGQQLATSPTIARRPVEEAIAWSRHADAHRSLLESFRKGMAQTAGVLSPLTVPGQTPVAAAQAEFEEASVRVCDPDNLPSLPEGARGGGANSFYMTPGRTYALCMTVATLIRTAYNYGPMALDFSRPIGTRGMGPEGRGLALNAVFGLGMEDGQRVRGGPDWVRTEPFTIEAVAPGAADAETMRGPMLLALLESRFRLKAHIETEQVPAFALTVAPGGPKMKAVQASGISPDGFVEKTVSTDACEPPPSVPTPAPIGPTMWTPRSPVEVRGGAKPSCGLTQSLNGPNYVLVGGAAGMPMLARQLGNRLGRVRVIDRTGITGLFNFILEFALDENTPGQALASQRAENPDAVPRGQTIFAAIEQQLGLRLEPARAPREFIVIDAIERPGPN